MVAVALKLGMPSSAVPILIFMSERVVPLSLFKPLKVTTL